MDWVPLNVAIDPLRSTARLFNTTHKSTLSPIFTTTQSGLPFVRHDLHTRCRTAHVIVLVTFRSTVRTLPYFNRARKGIGIIPPPGKAR